MFMKDMGNKYSSNRLPPRHAKKNTGGGIRMAGESVNFFSICVCSRPWLAGLVQQLPAHVNAPVPLSGAIRIFKPHRFIVL